MNKKYLISIENGFLIYQPESDIVYKGSRKTMQKKHALLMPFLIAIVTPVFDFVADCVWPWFYFSNYILMLVTYNILMIISGVIYYKYVYTRNKEKLLQSQLEEIKLIDLKIKEYIVTFLLAICFILVLFLSALFCVFNIDELGKRGYFMIAFLYLLGIPIFFIELELKGRFLLIKHLSKLNKEE